MDEKPIIGVAADHTPYTGHDDRRAEGVMEAYVQAIVHAGGVPILLPVSLVQSDLERVVEQCGGVVITGGNDIGPSRYGKSPMPSNDQTDAAKDDLDLALVRKCIARSIPFLGICRGMQVLNVAQGGTLIQDIPTTTGSSIHNINQYPDHPLDAFAHAVRVEPNSLLDRCLGAETVSTNSRHHQAIDRLGRHLRIVAYASDGLPEAIELESHPFCLGVQWHPENLTKDLAMVRLFQAFVRAARRQLF